MTESKDETGRNKKRRRKETGEETKKEKAEEEEEVKDKEVEKDVMGWTLVTKSTKQRRKMIQIFVEVHGNSCDGGGAERQSRRHDEAN